MKEISLLCFIFSHFFHYPWVCCNCVFAPLKCKCSLIDNLFHVLFLSSKKYFNLLIIYLILCLLKKTNFFVVNLGKIIKTPPTNFLSAWLLKSKSSIVGFTNDSNIFLKKSFFFLYFWLHWVFVVALGLSLVALSRCYSSLSCAGLSLQWLLLWWSTSSRAHGLQ